MTRRGLWGGSSRKLTLLLLAVTVPPAATLVWLGLQLLQQDRSLLAQRDLERRQVAIQATIRSLALSVAEAERHFDGPVPDGMVRLALSAQGVEAMPANRVQWLPVPRVTQVAEDRRFAEAERLEFQGSVERALLSYQDAARSPEPSVRAGALLRVGRIRRLQRRWDEALAAYRSLARVENVAIADAPGDLQARRTVCAILEESGRSQELAREAAALEADLLAGRWTLDRPAWELTAAEIERWTGHPLASTAERRLFSAVADDVWNQRQRAGPARSVVIVENTPVTVLWNAQGAQGTAALVISPAILRKWTDKAIATGRYAGARLSVLGPSGEVLAGPPLTTGSAGVRAPASETGLPWTLALGPGDASPASEELASRQRLLLVGLASILLLLAGGSYFLWRVMQREFAVARLQTDFVSAVSHEFRTPLTSLRHVAELLGENDDMPRERRRAFYEALERNTERLHRLVESLLDFARMEGGRRPYDFQLLDAGALTAQVVADFQHEVAARGFTIDLDVEPTADVQVRADASSLTNALWNLLDNAVKYSPESSPVHVGLERRNGYVQIRVRDQGIGVPAHERAAIFNKFHRGEQARRLGIKGTGIGLAMVHEIVRAHQGRVEVDSELGNGSTFTIVLPSQTPGSSLRSTVRTLEHEQGALARIIHE